MRGVWQRRRKILGSPLSLFICDLREKEAHKFRTIFFDSVAIRPVHDLRSKRSCHLSDRLLPAAFTSGAMPPTICPSRLVQILDQVLYWSLNSLNENCPLVLGREQSWYNRPTFYPRSTVKTAIFPIPPWPLSIQLVVWPGEVVEF